MCPADVVTWLEWTVPSADIMNILLFFIAVLITGNRASQVPQIRPPDPWPKAT